MSPKYLLNLKTFAGCLSDDKPVPLVGESVVVAMTTTRYSQLELKLELEMKMKMKMKMKMEPEQSLRRRKTNLVLLLLYSTKLRDPLAVSSSVPWGF